MAKLKFSVNAWNRSANFLYQNHASRCRNDVFAHSPSRNASKQLFRFRFMPSQFEIHGAAASRTTTEHNAEGTAHHVHHGRTTRTQGRSRQNVSRRPRRTPRSRGRSTNRPRTPPRIPRTDHAEPIRAEMLTGCRSHRRSHSPRSRHKTRRALYCCISEQIPTAGANAPQNAIHGAEANRANLPRWTETHGAPTEHARSHIEPLLLILRTFTHKHINHA